MNPFARRLGTVAVAAVMAAPVAALPSTTANASVPAISAASFGMHYLNTGHAYPPLAFATARIWDMGVDWRNLQPSAPQYSYDPLGISPPQMTSDGYDQNAFARLDSIVQNFVNRRVDPILTMGITPDWAADTGPNCHHVVNGKDWGIQTCAPVASVPNWGDPWAQYVTKLAQRYQGKVHYFELWNEPNLHLCYNDSVTTLARMQQTAYNILHSYGEQLLSPSFPIDIYDGHGGYRWMDSFLQQPGGKAFDIMNLHLYPSDSAVKGGYGPEWSINTALAAARKVMAARGVNRPIWDTEHNVGRAPARGTVQGEGAAGAAAVSRTFILNSENHIARTYWYAADDRSWGGTWLENKYFTGRSYAGSAYATVHNLLVGKAALGCSRTTVGTNKWKYTCKFGTTAGHKTLLAIWTTGASYTYHAPAGTKSWYNVVGAHHYASKGKAFTITHTPIYVAGSFA